MFPYIITDNSITVMFPTGPKTVHSSHLNFLKIKEALKTSVTTGLQDLFDVKQAIVRWAKGLYQVTDEAVLCDGVRLPTCLESKVLAFLDEGLPIEPLIAFHERLKANPSRRAVQELYKFLENKNIPIGPDGCFYGYKSVRLDWYDIYSGTCLNTIGSVLSMPRNQVDDDASRTCSYGFHVGALEYVTSFGGARENKRILIVKVDPADVVSVPLDYNGQKMRVCRYTVMSEYTGPLPESLYTPFSDDTDNQEPEDIYSLDGSELPDDNDDSLDDDEWDECPGCYNNVHVSDNFCPNCGLQLL